MTHCVMCGSRKVIRRSVRVSEGVPKRPVYVTAEVCRSCGERYYDMAAMQKLDRERRGSTGKRRTG